LRPPYRAALLLGRVPPELCFPLSKGKTWSKVPSTSQAGEDIWRVVGVDSDPFGTPTVQTFRLSSYGGGEISVDAWFGKGIGSLQEVTEHHGTYDEDRQELIASNVGGATRTYQLKPARILPFSDEECSGPGWPRQTARPSRVEPIARPISYTRDDPDSRYCLWSSRNGNTSNHSRPGLNSAPECIPQAHPATWPRSARNASRKTQPFCNAKDARANRTPGDRKFRPGARVPIVSTCAPGAVARAQAVGTAGRENGSRARRARRRGVDPGGEKNHIRNSFGADQSAGALFG
jgi:hypothetical protein